MITLMKSKASRDDRLKLNSNDDEKIQENDKETVPFIGISSICVE